MKARLMEMTYSEAGLKELREILCERLLDAYLIDEITYEKFFTAVCRLWGRHMTAEKDMAFFGRLIWVAENRPPIKRSPGARRTSSILIQSVRELDWVIRQKIPGIGKARRARMLEKIFKKMGKINGVLFDSTKSFETWLTP